MSSCDRTDNFSTGRTHTTHVCAASAYWYTGQMTSMQLHEMESRKSICENTFLSKMMVHLQGCDWQWYSWHSLETPQAAWVINFLRLVSYRLPAFFFFWQAQLWDTVSSKCQRPGRLPCLGSTQCTSWRRPSDMMTAPSKSCSGLE